MYFRYATLYNDNFQHRGYNAADTMLHLSAFALARKTKIAKSETSRDSCYVFVVCTTVLYIPLDHVWFDAHSLCHHARPTHTEQPLHPP
jgi:hypothetical protein